MSIFIPTFIVKSIYRHGRLLVVLVELGLIAVSHYVAFLLRFDGQLPAWAFSLFLETLPWVLLIRGLCFIPAHLYEGVWRYAGIWDLRDILAGAVTSSVVFFALDRWVLGGAYPRTIVILDTIVLVFLLGGLRLVRRTYRELTHVKRETRVLIFGAGDAGEMIVRAMKSSTRYRYEPVGFVDDDPKRIGQRIHGVPVLGTRTDLRRIITESRPHEILIATLSIDPATLRKIVGALDRFSIRITVLPDLGDILNGSVAVDRIRDLAVEDLLTRAPIGLDLKPVRALVEGRTVLVTGAGGSIGSELCRQIAAFHAASLILYERYENSLYEIVTDLTDRGLSCGLHPVIGDVTDAQRLDSVMAEYQPDIVFHAAAHKHVPLMEQNACEAIKNNVLGTRLVAEAAERHSVDRFILISTDKAVNPTSVMGASKRVAELILEARRRASATSFLTVRFGNVLGSNGSVIPRFLKQIKAGGPVTVTHPDIRRFFMSIPEAVQLVLHAAAQGRSAVYVLDMGEQIKLLDMAKNLIRQAGFVPEDGTIPITFIGLRPGEKLFEEVVGAGEALRPTSVDKILEVHRSDSADAALVAQQSLTLEKLALSGRSDAVIALLSDIVPEFRPGEETQAATPRIPARVSSTRQPAKAPAHSWAMVCPACAASRLHRSNLRSVYERLRKSLTEERVYRCTECQWRGWMMPLPETGRALPPSADAEVPNLGSIDAFLGVSPPARRQAFSARHLQ